MFPAKLLFRLALAVLAVGVIAGVLLEAGPASKQAKREAVLAKARGGWEPTDTASARPSRAVERR
jgi:hypothetical protein